MNSEGTGSIHPINLELGIWLSRRLTSSNAFAAALLLKSIISIIVRGRTSCGRVLNELQPPRSASCSALVAAQTAFASTLVQALISWHDNLVVA